MNYDLPTSVEIDGREYAIRSDFRPVLDTIIALNDQSLSDQERLAVLLINFYVDREGITNGDEAIKKAMWFIGGGKETGRSQSSQKKIFDWEQDWDLIVAAVNAVIGKDVRSIKPFHWWSFLSAFMEIGESTFTTVISIRRKKQKGIKLEKYEQEFYRDNRDIIDLKKKVMYTPEEREILGITDDEE